MLHEDIQEQHHNRIWPERYDEIKEEHMIREPLVTSVNDFSPRKNETKKERGRGNDKK